MDNKKLILMALDARKNAYSPYSHFKVGAALLASSGKVYTGCNIENSSYPAGICAERTAFPKAISSGETKFNKIAIFGGDEKDEKFDYCWPCGICRQFMSEFCDPDEFKIVLASDVDNIKEFSLRELLPHSFELKGE